MKHAGIAELKADLSRYIDQVKAGNEVVVTERGVPVARLVPLKTGGKRAARRERLARAGMLLVGRGRVRKALTKTPKGKMLGKGVLAALLAEREEQR